ncbi:tyrosyl-DNA phosphodiesterase 1-like protein, partial [Dinothrombium tinctorium]
MASKAICKYGTNCYRKNPVHFQQFSHPWLDTQRDDRNTATRDESAANASKRQKVSDCEECVFGFHLTKVNGIDDEYNRFLCMDIRDILSSKHGKLKKSIQFNYMFEIDWLIEQYDRQFRDLPLFIVHQEKADTRAELEEQCVNYPNVKLIRAHLMDPFGTHHTKMMILHYEHGLRVVVHTANLIHNDWYQKTQGVWLSPIFPPSLTSSFVDTSKTKFQTDLLEYLASYHSSEINSWCDLIKKYDMSSATVFLIGSSPGRYIGDSKSKFGHLKVKKILSTVGISDKVDSSWPVIAQFSSIGTLGSTPERWLTGEFLDSLKTTGNRPEFKKTFLKLIFPCVEDVRNSLEGYMAGGSLPYSENVAKKQEYLKSYLHRWKSKLRGRDRASPHIKSYTRVSPDMKHIAWFMLTSANLSKAAWGALEKNGTQLAIRSYELGVLFIPKMFGSEEFFKVAREQKLDGDGVNAPFSFLLPFDVPLTQYDSR